MDEQVYNTFTRKLDEYLTEECAKTVVKGYCNGTYLYYSKADYLERNLCFRFPGATRGWIVLEKDEDVIKEVHFNEDVCFHSLVCYKESVKDIVPELIGMRLVLPIPDGARVSAGNERLRR